MTAEPTGHVMWSPDPVLTLPDDVPRVELTEPFEIRLPIRDITP